VGLGDVIAFAVGALRGHRLRTALSVAGVAVGIAAVVALTALGEGARGYVVREFMSLGSNLLIVLPGKVETTGGVPFGGTTHDLTIDDFRELARRLPGAVRAAPIATGTETVRFGAAAARWRFSAPPERLRRRLRSDRVGSRARHPDAGSEVVLASRWRASSSAASTLGQVVRIGDGARVVGVLAPLLLFVG
jgi:putative ABC transport system permease protein